MTTSRPNIDQLSFCIKNSHRLKNFRGSICGENLSSLGIESVAAAKNLGCSGCEGGVLGCCLGENGGGEGGGKLRGGGEEEEEGWCCCVVFHFVVRPSSFVRRGEVDEAEISILPKVPRHQNGIENESKRAARQKLKQANKPDRPYT